MREQKPNQSPGTLEWLLNADTLTRMGVVASQCSLGCDHNTQLFSNR
jgi:hypothetical protein